MGLAVKLCSSCRQPTFLCMYPNCVSPSQLPPWISSRISSCFQALARLTSLTQLKFLTLDGPAATPTASAVAAGIGVGAGAWNGRVQQLAAALERLTNLQALILSKVNMADSSGSERAFEMGWLPVVKAIAGLPKLQSLELRDMPLQGAVTALAPAQHLSNLCRQNCLTSPPALALTLSTLACKERLCAFHVHLDQWSRKGVNMVLSAIGQNLTGLQYLFTQVHPSLHLLDDEYLEPLRNLKQLQAVVEDYARMVLKPQM